MLGFLTSTQTTAMSDRSEFGGYRAIAPHTRSAIAPNQLSNAQRKQAQIDFLQNSMITTAQTERI
jgi:hypothetical protein